MAKWDIKSKEGVQHIEYMNFIDTAIMTLNRSYWVDGHGTRDVEDVSDDLTWDDAVESMRRQEAIAQSKVGANNDATGLLELLWSINVALSKALTLAKEKPSKVNEIKERQQVLDNFINSAVQQINQFAGEINVSTDKPLPRRCRDAMHNLADAKREGFDTVKPSEPLPKIEQAVNLETKPTDRPLPSIEEPSNTVTNNQSKPYEPQAKQIDKQPALADNPRQTMNNMKAKLQEIKNEAPKDEELVQLRENVQTHLNSLRTKIADLRHEAQNGSFPFYKPDELAGKKADVLERLLKNLDGAKSPSEFKQTLATFAHNHIDNKYAGGNEVDINKGRGVITQITGMDTSSTKLIKNFQTDVEEAMERPTARPR